MNPLLSNPVLSGLNEAIGKELFAHILDLNLAVQMQNIGYFGAEKYFRGESADEYKHVKKVTDYINDRGLVADIPAIPKQALMANSLKSAFEISLQAELDLEVFYVGFYEKCRKSVLDGGFGDSQTALFIQEMLEIQRKSIGEVKDFLATLKRCGNNEAALLAFDNRLLG